MKPASIFSEISEGAFLLHQQIVGLAKKDPEIQFLYKGCQVLFSPLLERPKILLFRFKPGGFIFHGHIKIVKQLKTNEIIRI